jgi:hypothetical protein
MKRRQWHHALELCTHLRDRELLSAELTFDAAHCLHELKRPEEVLVTLQDALDRFAGKLSADWLERCGDLALEQGRTGEALARSAYEMASEQLRITRTEGKRDR